MACKRTAASDLNHDNWNDDDEPEEAGTFVKAPQEVLKKRVVRAARRRLQERNEDGQIKSAFGSFSGFKTTPASTASPFSFLAAASKSDNPLTPQSSIASSNAATASNGAVKIPENGTDKPVSTFLSANAPSKSSESKQKEKNEKGEQNIFKKSSDYYAKLKGLNEGVAQWIKSHVDTNPFCILTPIFCDYERYLKEIEANHGRESSKSNSETNLEAPVAMSSELEKTISIEKATNDDSEDEKTGKSLFAGVPTKSSTISNNSDWNTKNSIFGMSNSNAKSMFGNTGADKTENKPLFGSTENNPFLNKSPKETKKEDNAETPKQRIPSSGYMSFSQTNTTNTSATFSFGQSSTTSTSPSAGFSFGSSKPFSFGSQVAAPKDVKPQAETDEKEDEDEPPKPDFKPITEEDAFFEKRCKVFVKKDGNFGDRGIGVLFLKNTPNGKTQLIVRADNSLGNILINTLLTASIPTKRMNKNTVMLVCLPLPDSEPPPTPVLLRVKTSDDADLLIETLDSNKK